MHWNRPVVYGPEKCFPNLEADLLSASNVNQEQGAALTSVEGPGCAHVKVPRIIILEPGTGALRKAICLSVHCDKPTIRDVRLTAIPCRAAVAVFLVGASTAPE